MSETLYHRRLFLNEKTGAAIVEASLEDNSYYDEKKNETRISLDGTLHITDCSRSIELTVNIFHGDEAVDDTRKGLQKLDRLIDTAQGLRDALARFAKREWPGKKF